MSMTLDAWWGVLHDSRPGARLSVAECRALAELAHAGRLVYDRRGQPDIVLTSYVWLSDMIFLPQALATRLCADLDGSAVSFEIDDLDLAAGRSPRGWSVVAEGTAHLVPALAVWSLLSSALGAAGVPDHWPPIGAQDLLIRIDVDSLRGHQITGTLMSTVTRSAL